MQAIATQCPVKFCHITIVMQTNTTSYANAQHGGVSKGVEENFPFQWRFRGKTERKPAPYPRKVNHPVEIRIHC